MPSPQPSSRREARDRLRSPSPFTRAHSRVNFESGTAAGGSARAVRPRSESPHAWRSSRGSRSGRRSSTSVDSTVMSEESRRALNREWTRLHDPAASRIGFNPSLPLYENHGHAEDGIELQIALGESLLPDDAGAPRDPGGPPLTQTGPVAARTEADPLPGVADRRRASSSTPGVWNDVEE